MAKGLVNGGFRHDLALGEEYESQLADILKGFGCKTVEVKADGRSLATGNVFVEFKQPSGPSGLATTEADWWAFYLVGRLAWVLVEKGKLRELCVKAYKQGRTAKGGDYDQYEGVLLPISWLFAP